MSSIETTPAGIPAQTIISTVLGSEDAIAVDFRIAQASLQPFIIQGGGFVKAGPFETLA